MGKQTITITVDSDVIEEIRQLKINISGEVNSYLKALLARYNEDIDGINIELEKIELDKALKKLFQWQTTTKNIQLRIEKWEELQKVKKEKELQKERETIEQSKSCLNCGKIMPEKMKKHAFGSRFVCNSCFLGASKKEMQQWEK